VGAALGLGARDGIEAAIADLARVLVTAPSTAQRADVSVH
jgi:hypothetical protein